MAGGSRYGSCQAGFPFRKQRLAGTGRVSARHTFPRLPHHTASNSPSHFVSSLRAKLESGRVLPGGNRRGRREESKSRDLDSYGSGAGREFGGRCKAGQSCRSAGNGGAAAPPYQKPDVASPSCQLPSATRVGRDTPPDIK